MSNMEKIKKKSKYPKGYFLKRLRESWPFYLFILPALIYLIIFQYGPMYGVQIAFKDYRTSKGIWGSEWVGLKHFIHFFQYPNCGKLIWNTLRINLLSILTFPCSVILALFLNEVSQLRFKKAVQMVTYMPHFLTEVVVCSLVILFLDRTTGPINNLITILGGERQAFMGMPEAFPLIYVLSGLWQSLGWGTILYTSALSSISSEEVEAARIDGASRFQVMWYINIPGILPTIIITLIMRMGSLFGVGYTKVLLLQNDLNLDTSTVISTYTYEIGLLGGQFSYSSAIGLFNNLVNIVLLLTVNKIAAKVSETSLF